MTVNKEKPKLSVAMLGSRMGYAVPKALYCRGWLDRFYTDYFTGKAVRSLLGALPCSLRPRFASRILARDAGGVPSGFVSSFNLFGLEYARRLRSAGSDSSLESYLWAGSEFNRLVSEEIDWAIDAIYSFNTASMELFQNASANGTRCVLEQTIAPYAYEARIMDRERQRFSGWEQDPPDNELIQRYAERESSELKMADVIFCGSDFVKDQVESLGGLKGACVVVPYGITLPGTARQREASSGRPLHVLFVGTVCLRKGIQYVVEASRTLRGKAEFKIVGPVMISKEASNKLSGYMDLVGATPRSEMIKYWDWADVLLLPSLCEGSAAVTYEALSLGVPVVCTRESGSVVKNGEDGLIIDSGSSLAVTEAINRLCDSRHLLCDFSRNAALRKDELSLSAYGKRLLKALECSL